MTGAEILGGTNVYHHSALVYQVDAFRWRYFPVFAHPAQQLIAYEQQYDDKESGYEIGMMLSKFKQALHRPGMGSEKGA
ncbi:MAG: hypothetical protein ACRETA_06250 [Gammaproteobacteria bacterium]